MHPEQFDHPQPPASVHGRVSHPADADHSPGGPETPATRDAALPGQLDGRSHGAAGRLPRALRFGITTIYRLITPKHKMRSIADRGLELAVRDIYDQWISAQTDDVISGLDRWRQTHQL